jgi:glycerol-3-phosphate dehydrogenase
MDVLPKTRRPLEGERFQVIVIGGGINGVAIARECARAKRRTLLVEQTDFGAGTTSRSTRIIHGGLRYLEHGEIAMVRESLRERQRLLRDHSHLVRPLHFLVALGPHSPRSALKVRIGLWLYRRFAGGRILPSYDAKDRQQFEALLDAGQRWSVFDYEDAQCEFPERLVAEWLVEAAAAGAVIRNYAQVLAIDVTHGRAKGVLLRDLVSGKEERVEAGWVINATGPWADRVCQRSQINTGGAMIGGVRGSHIVVPKFTGAPNAAVFTEASDQRPIFVIPWNEQLLVGTTEVADQGEPGRSQPSPEEIDYLLRSLQALYPGVTLSRVDLRYAFAGVRPLPFARGKRADAITRRHILHDHSDEGVQRLISVIGGKLTTAVALARDCARKIGIKVDDPRIPLLASGAAADAALDDFIGELIGQPGLSETAAEKIAEWHGPRTLAVAQLARSNPAMRAALCPHTEHIVAEAVDAIQHEFAVTLGDVLLRRVPVSLGGCWSTECSEIAAHKIASALGWSDAQMKQQLENFEAERSAFLSKPSNVGATTAAKQFAEKLRTDCGSG